MYCPERKAVSVEPHQGGGWRIGFSHCLTEREASRFEEWLTERFPALTYMFWVDTRNCIYVYSTGVMEGHPDSTAALRRAVEDYWLRGERSEPRSCPYCQCCAVRCPHD